MNYIARKRLLLTALFFKIFSPKAFNAHRTADMIVDLKLINITSKAHLEVIRNIYCLTKWVGIPFSTIKRCNFNLKHSYCAPNLDVSPRAIQFPVNDQERSERKVKFQTTNDSAILNKS